MEKIGGVRLLSAFAVLLAGSACVDDAKDPVLAETIALDRHELVLQIGAQETLVAAVAPEQAADRRVSWVSSDETVATVSGQGVVCALAVGRAVISACAAGQTACCTVDVTASKGIYAAGVVRSSAGRNVAVVWQDGVAEYLTDGTQDAAARSVSVTPGGDVYVAGFVDDGQRNTACLWKNGVVRNLSVAGRDAQALSLCIADDGTVYVAGYETNSEGVCEARVWSDPAGSEVTLELPATDSYATAVCMSSVGGRPCVAGYMQKEDGVNTCGVFWRDGERDNFPEFQTGHVGSRADALCVAFNNEDRRDDFYAAGSEFVRESYNPRAVFFLHNLISQLQGSNRPGMALAVGLYDGDFYTAGWALYSETKQEACVWRNHEELYRLTSSDAYGSHAYALCITSDGKIYAGGYELLDRTQSPVIWLNGERFAVLDTRTELGTVYGMFVR